MMLFSAMGFIISTQRPVSLRSTTLTRTLAAAPGTLPRVTQSTPVSRMFRLRGFLRRSDTWGMGETWR
jgi:hypothetical protein